MIDALKLRLEKALETDRAGFPLSAEDYAVAALVAAPFAGAFGVWLSALTWWPNPVIWTATALAQSAGTLWIARRRRATGNEA